jgi:alpha-glucosidase (family GH31 glycosyl hydrolase)
VVLSELPPQPGFSVREYYTGYAQQLRPVAERPATSVLEIPVDIPRGGTYTSWLMTAQRSYTPDTPTRIELTLHDEQGKSVGRTQSYTLPVERALIWHSGEGRRARVQWKLPGPGRYTFRLRVPEGESGRPIFDRFLLSPDPEYVPAGYAHPDSVEVILPPAWAFGVLFGGYTNQAGSIARVDSLIAADFPVDGYWIDSYFWDYGRRGDGPGGYVDFIGDRTAYPDVEAMWNHFEERGIKGGIWIWNTVLKTGNEATFAAFEERGYFDSVFINTNGWHNEDRNTPDGVIDFDKPEAVAYWKDRLAPFFAAGLDFLKLDRSSEIPFLKAAFEATQELGEETAGRGFILNHLHSTYDPRYRLYPTKWSGDAKIAWQQPDYPNLGNYSMGALRENILMVADSRRSTADIPFLAHDAGGYNFFGSKDLGDELYVRWLQFSSFQPLMTFFSTADNPTSNLPYRFGTSTGAIVRKYAHLHQRLFPYVYSYAHRTRNGSGDIVGGDGIHPDQFLFGNELLVAPVYVPGQREREVYLPDGEWYDYHTGAGYRGGRSVTIPAPLEDIPLLARAGAIVPLRPYHRTIAGGSNDTLSLQVWTGADGSFTLYEDDGSSNGYREGEVATTELIWDDRSRSLSVAARRGRYDGMAISRNWEVELRGLSERPDRVTLNGEPVEGWTYSPEKDVLSLNLGEHGTDSSLRLNLE